MKEKIENIIKEFTTGTHLYLVDMQVRGKVVDISLDGDCGVNINECGALNRFLHRKLEEQGIDTSEYTIEVASPGLDRPLEHLRDYQKNVGRRLQVRNNQNKLFTGKLSYADKDKIILTGTGKSKKPELIEVKAIKEAITVI